MGGLGSGRQSGWGLLVDKCNDYHSVDLAWLRHKTAPNLMSKLQKILAMQEPSTQDI